MAGVRHHRKRTVCHSRTDGTDIIRTSSPTYAGLSLSSFSFCLANLSIRIISRLNPHQHTAARHLRRQIGIDLVRIPFLVLMAYRWASKQMWFLWEVAVTGSIAWPPLSILNVDFEEMLWTLSMKWEPMS